jgi:hypothetical protein
MLLSSFRVEFQNDLKSMALPGAITASKTGNIEKLDEERRSSVMYDLGCRCRPLDMRRQHNTIVTTPLGQAFARE